MRLTRTKQNTLCRLFIVLSAIPLERSQKGHNSAIVNRQSYVEAVLCTHSPTGRSAGMTALLSGTASIGPASKRGKCLDCWRETIVFAIREC